MSNTAKLQQRLKAEQETLHKELTELGVQNLTVPEDWIATPADAIATEADENVVADRAEEWMERRGEIAELETRYNNVLVALDRMAAGTYGICTVCQQAIEPERLEANPAASTCAAHREGESNFSN